MFIMMKDKLMDLCGDLLLQDAFSCRLYAQWAAADTTCCLLAVETLNPQQSLFVQHVACKFGIQYAFSPASVL